MQIIEKERVKREEIDSIASVKNYLVVVAVDVVVVVVVAVVAVDDC